MLTLSHSSNPIIYNNLLYRDKKMQKNLNNVWNQNVNVTKRASFTTFSISMADDLCLRQMYRWNTIKTWLPRLIINALHGSKFQDHSWFFHRSLKKLAVVKRLFWQMGDMLIIDDHCCCRKVLTRVNVWIVLRDKIKWPLWRGGC